MKQVISKDGTSIAYDELGSGPTVILVGGAMIDRKFAPFAALATKLSAQFHVINYDRRGRGDSTNTLPYSADREVEDLNALIVRTENPFIFGISSGAALVIRAVSSGSKVRAVALYEPPFVGNSSTSAESLKYLADIESLAASGKRAEVVKSFMKHVGVPAIIRWIMPLMSFWKSAIKIAHTIPYDLHILGDKTVPTELISRIKVPALVMSGERSSAELREAARSTAAAFVQGHHLQLKGQRHDVAPAVLAEALSTFFSKQL